jgi:hypothetical protein
MICTPTQAHGDATVAARSTPDGSRPMHRLVVARYAESLDWVTHVPDTFDIIVANKGAPILNEAVRARARITERPNVGREGETYLHHIASTRLEPARGGITAAGYTVFTQGDPFEHSPDFLALLEQTAHWQDVQPLSWRWKIARDIPPTAILARETGAFVCGLRVRPEQFSLTSWAPLGFDDAGTQWLNATYRRLHGLPEGSNIAAHFLDLCGLRSLALAAYTHRLGQFAYGAVFAVRTGMLANVPPDALAHLREATCAHSVYGYVLERLWLHLFGIPFLLSLDATPDQAAMLPAHGTRTFQRPETANTLRRQKIVRLARRVGHLVAGR